MKNSDSAANSKKLSPNNIFLSRFHGAEKLIGKCVLLLYDIKTYKYTDHKKPNKLSKKYYLKGRK